MVVATRLDVPFIDDVKDLSGKTVGFTKGYSSLEYFKTNYPLVMSNEVLNWAVEL